MAKVAAAPIIHAVPIFSAPVLTTGLAITVAATEHAIPVSTTMVLVCASQIKGLLSKLRIQMETFAARLAVRTDTKWMPGFAIPCAGPVSLVVDRCVGLRNTHGDLYPRPPFTV